MVNVFNDNTSPAAPAIPTRPPTPPPQRRHQAWFAVAAGVAVALLLVDRGLSTLGTYGAWLFVLTPLAIGTAVGFACNLFASVTARETTGVVLVSVVMAGAFMIAFGIEGLVCLAMSLPITVPMVIVGGLIGRLMAPPHDGQNARQGQHGKHWAGMIVMLALPLGGFVEAPAGQLLHEVRSSVIINGTPDAVWPQVVAFPELPAPTDWLSRAGVAYPRRAHIDGNGVGAVRYCVFSTGPFVEPITQWEPGRRLSFDVAASPAPVRELSPWRELAPPHLHGYLRPQRGEFRLVDLGDGRTRLEGSTWYEIEMAPEFYWRAISDALIHRIHLRVLEHIKQQVES